MDGDGGLAAVESSARQYFGQIPVRASVSFVGVDPIEVLRFDSTPNELAYLTLGMSRHPMTAADASMHDAAGPRAELLMRVHRAEPELDDVWRQLAVLAAAPAVEGVVFEAGMTVELGRSLAGASRCIGVLLVDSDLEPVTVTGGVTQILQALPATSTELAYSRVHGAAAVREKWAQEQTDLLDLARRSVRLD